MDVEWLEHLYAEEGTLGLGYHSCARELVLTIDSFHRRVQEGFLLNM